ncbi:MAG: 50S ribosomal protein L15, partial [bacterium]
VVGRGHGTGIGKTSGRGMKGQTARSGVSGLRLKSFRSLMLSIPKARGFTSFKKKLETVTTGRLASCFESKAVITEKALKEKGILTKTSSSAKIVLSGEVKFPLTIKGLKCSKGATEAILKAGGQVIA